MRPRLIPAAIVPLVIAIAFQAFPADENKTLTTIETADKLLEIGALPEAARAYAAFARDFAKDPRAPQAFAYAVIMNSRLDRGNIEIAESDLQHFENRFVPVNLDIWAEMVFTLIDGFAIRNDLHSALTLLHRTIAVRDQFAVKARKKKTYDLQTLREIEIRARGRLARVYTEMGDHRGAEMEQVRIQKVNAELGIWPGKKPEKNKTKYPETIDFIAETFFHFAELKRFESERLHLPAYLGNGDRDSVLVFVNGPGRRWYENREFAAKEAHRLYAFVLGAKLPKPEPPKPPPLPSAMIGLVGGDPNAPEDPGDMDPDPVSPDYAGSPPPSPRWAIAASERIGNLWSSFVQESRMMPIPKDWRLSGLMPNTDVTYAELEGEYGSFADSPNEVQKQRAKQAYRYCIDLSIKHQIVNDPTRACIAWLSKNYVWEYHDIDDFAPPGDFVSFGRVTRPAPLPLFTH